MMRYLFGVLCLCALGVVPLPRSASAQAGEPSSEKAALQFQLDFAGVVFTLIPGDEHTFEEMELRVKRAVPKVALAIHTQHRLPPQLMLRPSYYLYLDADADNGATSDQTEPNAEEPKSAQADGEVATSESNLEEPVSSPAPGTEAPDIDTLSRRAIEHNEIQSAQSGRQGGTGRRSRGAKAGIAVGVILGVGLVGFGIGAAVAMSNWEF